MSDEIKVKEPIQINENLIKFKVWSFYGNPQDNPPIKLLATLQKVRPRSSDNWQMIIRLKRIREALEKEGEICNQIINELIIEFALKDADGKPIKDNQGPNGYAMTKDPEKIAEFNKKYFDFMNQDISLDFEQIKSTQIYPPESLKELDVLEGVIEIVES